MYYKYNQKLHTICVITHKVAICGCIVHCFIFYCLDSCVVENWTISSELWTARFLHTQSEYEGCLLFFGIREQKQILIIENRFIVFQNIPH